MCIRDSIRIGLKYCEYTRYRIDFTRTATIDAGSWIYAMSLTAVASIKGSTAGVPRETLVTAVESNHWKCNLLPPLRCVLIIAGFVHLSVAMKPSQKRTVSRLIRPMHDGYVRLWVYSLSRNTRKEQMRYVLTLTLDHWMYFWESEIQTTRTPSNDCGSRLEMFVYKKTIHRQH